MQTLKHNGFDVSQPWVLWITADTFLALHFKYVLEGITDLKEEEKKIKIKTACCENWKPGDRELEATVNTDVSNACRDKLWSLQDV